MENKLEESKQSLVNIAFAMLSKDKKVIKQNKSETLAYKDIEWKHYESYDDMLCAVFVMHTNKGLFLFKVGGKNMSYTPL